jgi:hypothetical protein
MTATIQCHMRMPPHAARALGFLTTLIAVVGAFVCCGGSTVPEVAGDSGPDTPTHDAGACYPREGSAPVMLPDYPNAYLANELPSGSCADEGAICDMSAFASWFYCSDSGYPQADGRKLVACSPAGFVCTCHGHWWDCEIVSGTAGGCHC